MHFTSEKRAINDVSSSLSIRPHENRKTAIKYDSFGSILAGDFCLCHAKAFFMIACLLRQVPAQQCG
jgi:hypothetical protein